MIWSFLCSCRCGSPSNQNPAPGGETMAGQQILKSQIGDNVLNISVSLCLSFDQEFPLG